MTLMKIMKGSTFPYPSRGENNTLSSELIHLGAHRTIDEKKEKSVLRCREYNKSEKVT
jgi:hypothetical protein